MYGRCHGRLSTQSRLAEWTVRRKIGQVHLLVVRHGRDTVPIASTEAIDEVAAVRHLG